MNSQRVDTTTVEAALAYARRGWRVVPIIPGTKRPPMDAWQDAATTDLDLIRRWWTRWGDHGVGIATGEASGIFVLDVDVSDGKAGDDTLADLEATYGTLPRTVEAITGSGGRHIYLAWPLEGEIRNSASGVLGPGLDIRGAGGQVAAPPTTHPNGRRYEWEATCHPEHTPVADAPPWLIELLTRAPDARRADRRRAPLSGDEPGVRFAASVTWPQLLEADGATYLDTRRTRDGANYEIWARPGVSDHNGATLYYGGTDLLKVFTPNWGGPGWHLEAEQTYTRFGYYAFRHHGGDFPAAARALAGAYARTDAEAAIAELVGPAGRLEAAAEANGAPEGQEGDKAVDDPDEGLRAVIRLQARRSVGGRDFVLGVPEVVESVWGMDEEVVWPSGEPFLIVGPSGVGKTTLTQQVVKGRLGKPGNVVNWPVVPTASKVLYLAMDRPAQIARSLRRMFTGEEEELLEHLHVWRGPLPFNLVKEPRGLAVMAAEFGCDTVVVDSLKDLASKISDEEVGSQINAAFQLCIVDGIEVGGIHHQRKSQGDNRKPKTLDDVYGSQMLINGAGSVVLLWGQAGDPVVELSHLKQPMETVGPLTVTHDHLTGTTFADEKTDVLAMLRGAPAGLDAVFVAREMFGEPTPSRPNIEKARRRLDRLVELGHARREEGSRGGNFKRPAMWFGADPTDGWVKEHESNHAEKSRSNHGLSRPDESAGQKITEVITDAEVGEAPEGSNGTEESKSRSNHGDRESAGQEITGVITEYSRGVPKGTPTDPGAKFDPSKVDPSKPGMSLFAPDPTSLEEDA